MPETVRPARLRAGDTVAIVSPAFPTVEPADAFEQGVAVLESHGFQGRVMPHARDQWGYLAGTDADRLADLHAAFADPEVKAILCSRGGYGCMRILGQLDLTLIARNPKILIGFSDVTAFHLGLWAQTGLVGFYGPMMGFNLIQDQPFSHENLFPMVRGEWAYPRVVANQDAYTCLVPGQAEGTLLGGNLSILAALCGTPFMPDLRGAILFLEDWIDQYAIIDRRFAQLKLAGALDGLAGVVLCDFSHIPPSPGADFDLTELLRRLTANLGCPVGYGLTVGHGAATATLPVGVPARWDASSGTLTLLASPVL